jgi:hypothetical protein
MVGIISRPRRRIAGRCASLLAWLNNAASRSCDQETVLPFAGAAGTFTGAAAILGGAVDRAGGDGAAGGGLMTVAIVPVAGQLGSGISHQRFDDLYGVLEQALRARCAIATGDD